MKTQILSSFLFIVLASGAFADAATEVNQLQQRWAQVNYQLEGDAQLEAFEALLQSAKAATSEFQDSASVWIWSGIIKSTYAGARGGLGALSLAKEARRDLEKAMEIDAKALDGSAYASLGTLYFSVPGWPVGFGDNKKAEELLLQALSIAPDSIDNNYFYASYLIDRKRYDEAREYLQRARQAPKRPGRPIADAGRQEEITMALQAIDGKH